MNAGVVNAVEKQFIRIENITIENFKNVKKGTISLKNRRKNYRASILGLYGQNGSGADFYIKIPVYIAAGGLLL